MKVAIALMLVALLPLAARSEQATPSGRYLATAYSQSGKTRSGVETNRHIVAADPDYLPLGTRIKIRGAGRYSGEYVVADTGEKIVGRHLDIYIPNTVACQKFGKKTVRVKVIELGHDTKTDVVHAEKAVKQDVKQDLQKAVVGNAATETDWALHQKQMAKKDDAATDSAAPTAK